MVRKTRLLLLGITLILGEYLLTSLAIAQHEISLYPEIQPFKTDYLKVSEIHKIYYELSGNPDGIAVFGLHGGPGGSSSPYMRRFFNPEKFLIVLHDQRSAGKSKPFADIRENTTQHLVKDIETLRKLLKLDKIILFGGSWGSTLALAYAEAYPKNVAGMVLRGIFAATEAEIDHFYHGGVRKYFPEVYDKFAASLPKPDQKNYHKQLFDIIQNGTDEKRAKYSRIWAEYEIKISGLDVPDENLQLILESFDPLAFGLLENYYMANGCFLKEDQLFKNTNKIRHIPLTMVNGRYDLICPPVTAYRFHQALPKSKLVIAEAAGHWMGEKPIEMELLKAMQEFE
ncbi:prolyl aminopeptidase [candidate division KSB1 bacterium]|nr:prolyl aminopeptidase [candidate division KSB1 bacterium]